VAAGARIRSVVQRLVPPLVTDVPRRRRDPARASRFEGAYPDYAAAAAAASPHGYEHTDVVTATIRRTEAVRDRVAAEPAWVADGWTLQNLAALSVVAPPRPASAGGFRVLDFGGGMGIHYFGLRRFLAAAHGQLSWVVCETEATARAGRDGFANGELEFVDDLFALRDRFDVVLASGALQYTPDPPRYLGALARLSDALVVNRAPLADIPADRLTVQVVKGDLHGARLPAWFFAEAAWLSRLADAGLDTKLRWIAAEDTVTLDGADVRYQGLAARRGT
jgi:putative methyltransferase (TIGR04325 family)